MTEEPWVIDIGRLAEDDLATILEHTRSEFGARQAEVYETTLLMAVQTLLEGPEVVGSKRCDDISPGLRMLHVARMGRRGRHFVAFRAAPPRTIRILRFLYDGMDFARHIDDGP